MPFYIPPNIEIARATFVGAAQIGAGGVVTNASANLLPLMAFAIYNTNGTTGKLDFSQQLTLWGHDSGNNYFLSNVTTQMEIPANCRIALDYPGSDYISGNPLNEGLDFAGAATIGALGTLEIIVISAKI